MRAPQLPSRLDVGQALRDGWRAFRRAPWLFMGFVLVLTGLQVALSALQPPMSADKLPPLTPDLADLGAALAWLRYSTVVLGLFAINLLAGVVLNLWGTCGMVRAAWVALGGGRPHLRTFLHFDPRALVRLYLPGFLLGVGVTAAVVMLVLLAVVLSQASPLLALPPLLLMVFGTLYLTVSQAFLPQVALLHDDHPFEALARGHQVVDPVWGNVVVLGLLNAGLLIAGVLAFLVGVFVAAPLVICVSTAAYRQLFGPEDRTGLLGQLPAEGA
jgi:hypothetical protein